MYAISRCTHHVMHLVDRLAAYGLLGCGSHRYGMPFRTIVFGLSPQHSFRQLPYLLHGIITAYADDNFMRIIGLLDESRDVAFRKCLQISSRSEDVMPQ